MKYCHLCLKISSVLIWHFTYNLTEVSSFWNTWYCRSKNRRNFAEHEFRDAPSLNTFEQHDFPYPGTGKGNVTSLALHLSLPLTTFITNNNEWRKRSVTSSIRQYLWDWSSFPVGFVSVCYRSSVLSHLRRVTSDSAVDCFALPCSTLSLLQIRNLKAMVVPTKSTRTFNLRLCRMYVDFVDRL